MTVSSNISFHNEKGMKIIVNIFIPTVLQPHNVKIISQVILAEDIGRNTRKTISVNNFFFLKKSQQNRTAPPSGQTPKGFRSLQIVTPFLKPIMWPHHPLSLYLSDLILSNIFAIKSLPHYFISLKISYLTKICLLFIGKCNGGNMRVRRKLEES